MVVIKNAVLLLKADKSEDGCDKYAELLTYKKFEVMLVKTLSFEYQNLAYLAEKLLHPEAYSGIILSSPRCVNAVRQSLPKEKINELWSNKSNFTVGEASYKDAKEKLGVECRGKETGNSTNLSRLIIQDKTKFDKPFLFPHGNLKTDNLKKELGKENLEIEGVEVYTTVENPCLKDELCQITKDYKNIPEFIIFFSPSGVRSAVKYLRNMAPDFQLVKFVAIGPVTEEAIKQEELKVFKVAKNPTPDEVLKALE